MNFRKFYFVLALIVSVFLFGAGALVLNSLDTGAGVPANALLEEILKPFRSANSPVNILVLGGDRVNKNTDTIMLVNFNPATAKASILSIPRDTKVKIKGHGTQKINAAYPAGGASLAVDTVSGLLDVKVKYYIFIDTSAFRKIIDLLGGVDFDVPADMNYDDPVQNLHIHLKKGMQHLDGAKAEQFMRFRHPTKMAGDITKYYDGSDLKRIEAQQRFIKEFIRQKANIYNLAKLNGVLKLVFENLETNLSLDEVMKLARNAPKVNADDLQMFKLPGGSSNEPSGWYYIMDRQGASEIVKKYFNAPGGISETNAVPEANNKNTAPAKTNNNNSGNKNGSQSSAKKSMTQDNPSNGESSIKGTTKENP